VLAVAAGLVVVALVGVAVAASRGDGETSVDVGPVATAPTGEGSVPLLDAVWPTAVESEVRSAAPEAARQQYPWGAASAYLESRLGIAVAEDGFTLVSGDATNAVLHTTNESVDTDISMQRLGSAEDPVWYVVRATSLNVMVTDLVYDGERVHTTVTPLQAGELSIEVEPADTSDPVIALESRQVEPGHAIEVDEALPGEGGVVVRAILRPTGGGVAMTEQLAVHGGGWSPAPDAEPPSDERPSGIWPWPAHDVVDAAVLQDPRETALAFAMAVAGPDLGETVASAFRAADATSGEVVLTGEVTTTVFVRTLDGRWHVEAAASDLVTAHGADDGTTTVRFEVAGAVDHREAVNGGADSEQASSYDVAAGTERTGFGYTLGRDDAVQRHVFVLSAEDGTRSIAAFGFRASPVSHGVSDDAVWAETGDDPATLATAYLVHRLGEQPTGVRLVDGDGPTRTVDWDGGAVLVRRGAGDRWHVIESIGASVSFESLSRSEPGGEVLVRLFAGEPGVIDVLLTDVDGDPCGQGTIEVEARGPAETALVEDAGTTCDGAVVARAVLGGSLAERRI